jgi:hypothetical protein
MLDHLAESLVMHLPRFDSAFSTLDLELRGFAVPLLLMDVAQTNHVGAPKSRDDTGVKFMRLRSQEQGPGSRCATGRVGFYPQPHTRVGFPSSSLPTRPCRSPAPPAPGPPTSQAAT